MFFWKVKLTNVMYSKHGKHARKISRQLVATNIISSPGIEPGTNLNKVILNELGKYSFQNSHGDNNDNNRNTASL